VQKNPIHLIEKMTSQPSNGSSADVLATPKMAKYMKKNRLADSKIRMVSVKE